MKPSFDFAPDFALPSMGGLFRLEERFDFSPEQQKRAASVANGDALSIRGDVDREIEFSGAAEDTSG